MTVAELIEQLKLMPQDADAKMECCDCGAKTKIDYARHEPATNVPLSDACETPES